MDEVQKKNKEHNCEAPEGNHYMWAITGCYEYEGELIVGNGEYDNPVAFCPFCGMSAKELSMKTQPDIHRVEVPLEELIDKAYLMDDPSEAAAYMQSLGFDTTREITWVDEVARPVRILTQKKTL